MPSPDPDWSWHIDWQELCIEWYDDNFSDYIYECKLCGFEWVPKEHSMNFKGLFLHYTTNHNEILTMYRLKDTHSSAEYRNIQDRTKQGAEYV